MKQFLTLILSALAFFSASASEWEDEDNFQKQVGILIEYFEVDHGKLTPMLRDYQKHPNANDLLEQTQKMAKKNEARLVESTYIVTRSGQRAKIESIRELIFPTEYDPAEILQELEGPIDRDAKVVTAATPTAYEMRPVGNSLEVDPFVTADAKYVEMSIAPDLVEFHGFTKWGKDESKCVQPLLHSLKNSTALTVKFGTSELLGVMTPSGSHDKKGTGKRVLCFVTPQRLSATSQEIHAEFRKNPKKWNEEREIDWTESAVDDPFAPAIPSQDSDEDAPQWKPKQVSLLTEYIEVDAQVASELIRELHPTSDASAIHQRIKGLVAKGVAKRLETSTIITRCGQRAKNESIHEMLYPTEYDPPEVPQELRGPIDTLADFITSAGATAFEMRPTGVTVEVDPVMSNDAMTIELNFASEMIEFIKNLHYGKGPALSQQPLFESIKLSTAVTLADRKPILLGMHSLETARAAHMATKEEREKVRNRRVLVFVTATIKTLD